MKNVRKLPDGQWKAEIYRSQGKGKPPIRPSFTHSRKSDVVAWKEELERKLNRPGGIDQYLERKKNGLPTVGDLINRYLRETKETFGSTKMANLKSITKMPFAGMIAEDLEKEDHSEFGHYLMNSGVKGSRDKSTVSGIVSTYSEVLRIAESLWGIDIDLVALSSARFGLNKLRVTGKSNTRDIRPNNAQIDELMDYFIERQFNDARCVPMHFIIAYAMFSGRRQAEIVDIRTSDFTDSHVIVRDMKHPKGSKGNHQRLWVTNHSYRVAQQHIRVHGKTIRVFPYSADTVSRLFTEACKLLNFEDLHFHDLRHEACSWLSETGWNFKHIMKVSGHSSADMVNRYLSLESPGDKWEDWKWFEIMENLPIKSKI